MQNIVLIGDGGHSKVIQDIIAANEQLRIVAILDDKYASVMDGPIIYAPLTFIGELSNKKDFKIIIAIGNNAIRQKIALTLQLTQERFISIVHPSAIISPTVEIGVGTVVMPNAVINAHSKIGNHVIVNTSSVIEHDNTIHNFVHIAPGATLAGMVHVAEGTQISVGATIIPNIKIGSWSLIGAGSTVIKNVPSYAKMVGSPAKMIG